MKRVINWYYSLNIYYKFTPFLLLYIAICVLFPKEINNGDQPRYLWFASNLLNGFYSPPYPKIDLWNGPGYPFLLAPFLFFKSSYTLLRILNAFLLYFSLIISYKTFRFYCSKKNALFFTMLLGLYFPIYEVLRQVLTESLTWFLISLICFSFVKSFKQKKKSWKLIILPALAISYLAMTRVIFGYVIISMLLVSLILCFLPKLRTAAIKSTLIFLLSFFLCLPWLTYTYHLTNRPFYWANSGGMSLYTMSTPYAGESGQWYLEEDLLKNPYHRVFIDSILNLTPLQRDDAYKKEAIKNITNHPKKYLTNFISNSGRLLFFPSDYAPDSIFSYYPFIPNMFVVVLILFSIVIGVLNYRRIPEEFIFLLLFFAIYLLGSTVVSAYRRMFHVTMPFCFLFIGYIFTNVISIKIRKNNSDNIKEIN